jgi:DNA ligase (NAD+)
MNEIVKLLEEASNVYYNTGETLISDAEFDALKEQLRQLYPDHPFLTRVGAKPTEMLSQVKHQIPMGSLNKVTTEDYPSWHNKFGGSVNVSLKMDGSSIEIIYENGKLVQAITRGDGIVGEDVTQNVRKFKNVPLMMNDKFSGSVRGEAILHIEDFKKFFTDKANPRNAANGTVRRKDGDRAEHLRFYAFDATNGKFNTHTEKLKYLENNGFDVTRYVSFSIIGGFRSVLEWFDLIGENRSSLPFEVDGVVVRLDNEDAFVSAGEHGNHDPKGAVVLKWEAMKAETVLLGVELTIGHTGAIVPTGKFKPVPIGGVTVSSVLLNNFDYIKSLGLEIGDTVLVERAGDVIPHVVKVVNRPEDRKPINIPNDCPFCGYKLVKVGVHIVCKNDDCDGKNLGLVESWIRKRNIKFIGDSILEMLYEKGFVRKPQDLYYLKEESLSGLPLGNGIVGERAKSIITEIEKSKECLLHQFIGSLGVKFLGRRQAEIMVNQGVDTLEKFQSISIDSLSVLDGFSTIKATGIVEGLAEFRETIKALLDAGVRITESKDEIKKETKMGKLNGQSYCFTGGINKVDDANVRYTRKRMWELVENNGGVVHEDVKPNTTFLVQADPNSQSSKTKKAIKNGVKILGEDDFFKSLA